MYLQCQKTVTKMIQAAMKINHLVVAIQNMRTNGAEDYVMVSVKEVKINRRSIEACQSYEMWKYDFSVKMIIQEARRP